MAALRVGAEPAVRCLDPLANPLGAVGAEGVEDDDVSFPERGHQDVLDMGLEDGGVGAAFHGHHRGGAVQGQGTDHGDDGPTVPRLFGVHPRCWTAF